MGRKFVVFALLAGAVGWGAQGLSGCVGDSTTATSDDASTDEASADTGAGSKTLGLKCVMGNDCQSGNCADGLCCDSPCNGVCESCSQGGSVGKCTPVPAGQDPDKECAALALPEAGVADDGGDLNLPDGGVALNDVTCTGVCDGKRACGYPGRATSCGGSFCNTTIDQGRAACDSKGHCQLGVDSCGTYACEGEPDGGCAASCVAETDCAPTSFCNAMGKCQPKFANGTACAALTQCQSAHCVTGPSGSGGTVCCNDECNITGGSCTQGGKVGQCLCAACPGGTCQLWYPDADGDGYGDKSAVPGPTADGTHAAPGCVANPDGGLPVPPGPGYVQNNTDCYDVNDAKGKLVHPNQATAQSTGYGVGNMLYDYNCNGATTKTYAEISGGTCSGCGYVNIGMFKLCSKVTCSGTTSTGHSCGGLFCSPSAQSAFHTTVACGAPNTLYTCPNCANGSNPSPLSQNGIIQSCL